MKFGPAFGTFTLLTVGYVAVLLYVDFRSQVFRNISDIALLVGIIAAISTCSFLLRFVRWRWLLSRRGFVTPWFAGCLAYFAGFALTALPGKLGELVRVRYFSLLGVPAMSVVACFVFERVIDLGVVLLLASMIASAAPGFWVGAAFAVMLILLVVLLMNLRRTWSRLAAVLSIHGESRIGCFVEGFGLVFSDTKSYFNLIEAPVAFLLGLMAFGLQALGFMYISSGLGFAPGPRVSTAIFPLATLIGAASMVPGGIGTTEGAIVVTMGYFGASVETALVAAIAMRLGTLWYAIAIGLTAAAALEIRQTVTRAVRK